jgi:hypothetical protein
MIGMITFLLSSTIIPFLIEAISLVLLTFHCYFENAVSYIFQREPILNTGELPKSNAFLMSQISLARDYCFLAYYSVNPGK